MQQENLIAACGWRLAVFSYLLLFKLLFTLEFVVYAMFSDLLLHCHYSAQICCLSKGKVCEAGWGFLFHKFPLVKNPGNMTSRVCILLLIKAEKFLSWLNCSALLSYLLL